MTRLLINKCQRLEAVRKMMVPRSQKISVASMMLDDALSKFQKEVKITGDDA